MNALELRLPVLAWGCASLINDKDLNVGGGSVFCIFVTTKGEVCANVAEASDALPPFAKVRMVKAHRLANNRDKASSFLESAQCASDAARAVEGFVLRHSATCR